MHPPVTHTHYTSVTCALYLTHTATHALIQHALVDLLSHSDPPLSKMVFETLEVEIVQIYCNNILYFGSVFGALIVLSKTHYKISNILPVFNVLFNVRCILC